MIGAILTAAALAGAALQAEPEPVKVGGFDLFRNPNNCNLIKTYGPPTDLSTWVLSIGGDRDVVWVDAFSSNWLLLVAKGEVYSHVLMAGDVELTDEMVGIEAGFMSSGLSFVTEDIRPTLGHLTDAEIIRVMGDDGPIWAAPTPGLKDAIPALSACLAALER